MYIKITRSNDGTVTEVLELKSSRMGAMSLATGRMMSRAKVWHESSSTPARVVRKKRGCLWVPLDQVNGGGKRPCEGSF
jgi:hypothetical protein